MHAPALQIIPPETLLLAYRSGIFPMADSREDPEVFWVEPRQRAILPLDAFHCSHSLAKELRRGRFEVSCNRAFAEVIEACAAPRPRHPESWISERIAASYRTLHQAGHAHSIECWAGGHLVGGLYGVAFDRVFCGESLFSLAPNASKVALAYLVQSCPASGITLIDCQMASAHLTSLGARAIARTHFQELLERWVHSEPLALQPAPAPA